jgi:hypothetical protein
VVIGYSDADWVAIADDRKSTSKGCFYVGTNVVAWMSRKQSSICLSIAEAEYMAAGSCCTQLLCVSFIDYILLTKILYCKVAIYTGMPYISESSKFMDNAYL